MKVTSGIWWRCLCTFYPVKRGWWIFSKIEVRRDPNPACQIVKHIDEEDR